MATDAHETRLAELCRLRARYESECTAQVILGNWDDASAAAKRAELVDAAIVDCVQKIRKEGISSPGIPSAS